MAIKKQNENKETKGVYTLPILTTMAVMVSAGFNLPKRVIGSLAEKFGDKPIVQNAIEHPIYTALAMAGALYLASRLVESGLQKRWDNHDSKARHDCISRSPWSSGGESGYRVRHGHLHALSVRPTQESPVRRGPEERVEEPDYR